MNNILSELSNQIIIILKNYIINGIKFILSNLRTFIFPIFTIIIANILCLSNYSIIHVFNLFYLIFNIFKHILNLCLFNLILIIVNYEIFKFFINKKNNEPIILKNKISLPLNKIPDTDSETENEINNKQEKEIIFDSAMNIHSLFL